MFQSFIFSTIIFTTTNIDDLVLLTFWFASGMRVSSIIVGQFLGIAILTFVSILGSSLHTVIPDKWIGLLGVIPVLVGIRMLIVPDKEDIPTMVVKKKSVRLEILAIAGVTVANGGDNLGVYIPVFATLSMIDIALYSVVFFFLTGLWLFGGFLLARAPGLERVLEKHIHKLLPFVLIGIGSYVMYSSI